VVEYFVEGTEPTARALAQRAVGRLPILAPIR
jgi:hypothetical protein